MGFDSNWQGMPLAKMYADINGGAGYGSTSESAAMWRDVAGVLRDTADGVRTMAAATAAEWQGEGSESMTTAHNLFDSWSDDAHAISGRADTVAHTQASLFTDTRPKIEAPGTYDKGNFLNQAKDAVENSVAWLPGVTTDQERFEQAEQAKQQRAAAAMGQYGDGVESDAFRGYFSTPPTLAATKGADPVAPVGAVNASAPQYGTTSAVHAVAQNGAGWTVPAATTSSSYAPASTATSGVAAAGAPGGSSGAPVPTGSAGSAVAPGSASTGASSSGSGSPLPAGFRPGASTSTSTVGGVPGFAGGAGSPAQSSTQAWREQRGAGSGAYGVGGVAGSGSSDSERRSRRGYGPGLSYGSGDSSGGARGSSAAGGYGPAVGAYGVGGGYGGGGYSGGAAGSGGGYGGGLYGSGGSAGGAVGAAPGGPGGSTGVGAGTGAAGSGTGVVGGPAVAGSRGGAMGGMGGAGAGRRGAEDTEHETPDYLKSFEHFEDGRLVAPPVIGVFDDEQ